MKRTATFHFSILPLGNTLKKGYYYIGPNENKNDDQPKEPHPKYTVSINGSDHFVVPETNKIVINLSNPQKIHGQIKLEIKHGISKETLPIFKYTSHYNSKLTHEFHGDAKYSVRFKGLVISLDSIDIQHTGFSAPPILDDADDKSSLYSCHFDTARDVELFSQQLQRLNTERRKKALGVIRIAHITETCKTIFYASNHAESITGFTVFYFQQRLTSAQPPLNTLLETPTSLQEPTTTTATQN